MSARTDAERKNALSEPQSGRRTADNEVTRAVCGVKRNVLECLRRLLGWTLSSARGGWRGATRAKAGGIRRKEGSRRGPRRCFFLLDLPTPANQRRNVGFGLPGLERIVGWCAIWGLCSDSVWSCGEKDREALGGQREVTGLGREGDECKDCPLSAAQN